MAIALVIRSMGCREVNTGGITFIRNRGKGWDMKAIITISPYIVKVDDTSTRLALAILDSIQVIKKIPNNQATNSDC